jgi:hypothetical protein
LCHGLTFVILGFAPSFLNCITDLCTDGLGFDDIVGSIDFGMKRSSRWTTL